MTSSSIDFAISVVDGAGQPPGRAAALQWLRPPVHGIFSNTPLEVGGRRTTPTMIEAAHRWLAAARAPMSPREIFVGVLGAVHDAMIALGSRPYGDDEFDARWDFGGHGGLVTVFEGHVYTAAIGDVRIVSYGDGTARTLHHENTLRAEYAQRGHEIDSSGGNVLTRGLGCSVGFEPESVVATAVTDCDYVLIAPYFVFDQLPIATLRRVVTGSARTVADGLSQTCAGSDGWNRHATAAVAVAKCRPPARS